MNNTLKYTVVAAIVIVAAAFGIQSFISKSSMQNVDVSTLSPAAGEPSDGQMAPSEDAMTGTGMEPPAMESGMDAPATTEGTPVDGAVVDPSAEAMPPQPAPMEGEEAVPSDEIKDPATAPSFEDEKVEDGAESTEN
ncbi:MAG: hypothetical protein H6862_03530 [Rhodospirillales bacterium]|nr:hypothetical protein [Rhodospirillales bacterium]